MEAGGEAASGGVEPLSEDAGRSMAICTAEGGVQPSRRLGGQSMAASFQRGPLGKRHSDILKGIDIVIRVDAGPLKSGRLPAALSQASICQRSPFSYRLPQVTLAKKRSINERCSQPQPCSCLQLALTITQIPDRDEMNS